VVRWAQDQAGRAEALARREARASTPGKAVAVAAPALLGEPLRPR
jgi:hypothetical protein